MQPHESSSAHSNLTSVKEVCEVDDLNGQNDRIDLDWENQDYRQSF
jgi:hypothetical protein